MNLLALIIVFLAIATAGAIAYIAWELSSGDPVFTRSDRKAPNETGSRDEPPGA